MREFGKLADGAVLFLLAVWRVVVFVVGVCIGRSVGVQDVGILHGAPRRRLGRLDLLRQVLQQVVGGAQKLPNSLILAVLHESQVRLLVAGLQGIDPRALFPRLGVLLLPVVGENPVVSFSQPQL